MADSHDVLERAYSRLLGLQKNLPNTPYVGGIYADEYLAILEQIEKLGYDLSDFRIPRHLITIRPFFQDDDTGEKLYDSEREVERAFLMAKLDAVLKYFEIQTQQPPRQIGFGGPKGESQGRGALDPH